MAGMWLDDDLPPPDVARRIDAVCERFEATWREGAAPVLEAYLEETPPPERGLLLPELVLLDAYYRRRRGEQPGVEDYRERFPGLQDDWLRTALTVGPEETAVFPAAGDAPVRAEDGSPRLGRFGDYDILGELGRGGMGVVYKARHVRLDRIVALKMIRGGPAGAADLDRFRTEAEAAARLQHPNVVQIYEIGVHDGLPFLALEYVAGGSLADRLDGTPLPAAAAAGLVEQLARAMHAAHRSGVVHRDLKPANVLLQGGSGEWGVGREEKTGRLSRSTSHSPLSTPKITDFGLAKKLDRQGATQSGAVLGTPSYMAPEQAGGRSKEVGPAADVYALGAILYELLTGRPPFKAEAPLATLMQVLHDEPAPPRQLQSRTPRDLETICLKCLQKEPKKRYSDAEALAEDLRRFRAGEPIRGRAVSVIERGWRWCRRRPLAAALAGTVAATLLIGASAVGYFAVQADAAARQAQIALQDQRSAEARARETALRFVKWLKKNPELLKLHSEELAAQFLESNDDLSPSDVRDAFEASVLAQSPEAGAASGQAITPNMFGD